MQVGDAPGHASGQITNVVGRVVDQQGLAIPGANVEIWQCNAYGRYHHPGDDRAKLDPYFQGYGTTSTDLSGRLLIRNAGKLLENNRFRGQLFEDAGHQHL